jgi:hypothetical protein
MGSRLPQLFSPNLLLDGDECILGLMAKHITEGKPVTVYFYGQKYGFAYFEALAGAISFKLFGYGAFQLKAAMLVLWLGSLAFFYLAAVRFLGLWQGFLLALVFSVFPAWAVWSLKARGGYLTSFLFASILLYVFANRRKPFSGIAWVLIGIALGIIFYAQAFWLAGLLPVILYHFLKQPRNYNFVWGFAGIALVAAFFYLFGTYTSNFWTPKVIHLDKNLLKSFIQLPDRLFWHLSGNYYLERVLRINTFIRITIFTLIVVLAAGFLVQFYRFWRLLISRKVAGSSDFLLTQAGSDQKIIPFLLSRFQQAPEAEQAPLLKALYRAGFRNKLFFREQFATGNAAVRKIAAKALFLQGRPEAYVFFLSVCFILGYSLFLHDIYYGYRYLLPLNGFVFLWLGIEINCLHQLKILPGKAIIAVALIMSVTGALALNNYRKFNFMDTIQPERPTSGTEEENLASLTTYLKANNTRHVFTLDQLLEWFPIFYSGEAIICRALPPIDRYPLYPEEVDKAYVAGKPTALIGYFPVPEHILTHLNRPEAIQRVGFRYFVYPNPEFKELVKLGFYKVPGKPASPEFFKKLLQRDQEIKKLQKAEF